MSGLPPDPLDPKTGEPLAEAARIGTVVFDGLLDALRRDGLFGLYPAVAALGRDDLERVSLAMVLEIASGGQRLSYREPSPAKPSQEVDEEAIPPGRRQMIALARGMLRDGERGLVEAARSRTNDELRVLVRDVLEEAWGALLGRRHRREDSG